MRMIKHSTVHVYIMYCCKKSLQDTKVVIRSRKLKNGQNKNNRRQTMICKILHRKFKIKQHEPTNIRG